MWIFRSYVFYPLVALISAAVVLVSFGPGLVPLEERAVQGTMREDALVLAGDDLAHPRAEGSLVYFVQRDARWQATGLRVAVKPGADGVDANERGLQILLAPGTAQWLGRGPLRIEVSTIPLPLTASAEFAFGLTRGGRTEWRALPVAPIRGTLVYDFPDAAAAPVESFGLRPIAAENDANRGVEVRSIRVLRLPPG